MEKDYYRTLPFVVMNPTMAYALGDGYYSCKELEKKEGLSYLNLGLEPKDGSAGKLPKFILGEIIKEN
jgi:hypothetical protein